MTVDACYPIDIELTPLVWLGGGFDTATFAGLAAMILLDILLIAFFLC